jgi:DNA-binding NarL/FixJ family response regulator
MEENFMKIKIIIVDDMERVRLGLRAVLEFQEDLEIVGEAADGREAVRLVKKLQPDVVLMDLEMPGMNGLEATRKIKEHHQATGVIALSIRGDKDTRQQAEMAGVDAFVEKGEAFDKLFAIIRHVFGGFAA